MSLVDYVLAIELYWFIFILRLPRLQLKWFFTNSHCSCLCSHERERERQPLYLSATKTHSLTCQMNQNTPTTFTAPLFLTHRVHKCIPSERSHRLVSGRGSCCCCCRCYLSHETVLSVSIHLSLFQYRARSLTRPHKLIRKHIIYAAHLLTIIYLSNSHSHTDQTQWIP